MSEAPIAQLTTQTLDSPMQSLGTAKDHLQSLSQAVSWCDVGVFHDDVDGKPRGVIVLLLEGERAVAAMRVCLSVPDSVAVLALAARGSTSVWLSCWRGASFSADQVRSLDSLSDLWERCDGQRSREALSAEGIGVFFERIEEGTRKKGRGPSPSSPTRNQVLLDSHGRCMFDGCAIDLTSDPITGSSGNFAALAHNVASAESGRRGVMYLSGELADDPDNILLLCDTHHRLVDTIAHVDYPAFVLTQIRRRFCSSASRLLDGLSRPPVPVYVLSWPVRGQVVSPPSDRQIAQSLEPVGVRMDGQPNVLSDNEPILRSKTNVEWEVIPSAVERVASQLEMQLQPHGFRAALFGIGLMPPLIALGARLGNKSEITPMLRHRDSNLWYWPAPEPRNDFFSIEGFDDLRSGSEDVTLLLAFTAEPSAMSRTAQSLEYPVLAVRAKAEFQGNGALGHPADGDLFRATIQRLLHRLFDEFAVRRVHVLPCASNAACVFFGQAYDSHHPELIVYDFDREEMVPRLRIHNHDNRCLIDSA